MTDQSIHPAAQANMDSIRLMMAKDKAGWLDLYADDAIVSDPVGKSPFDLEGKGHIGKAAIEQFWDMVIAPSNAKLTAGLRCSSGDKTCAVPMTAVNDLGDGNVITINMVAIYQLNDAGKIASMKAYWDWSEMEAQLAQLS
jgi:ketosteroid isomerase-like protein|tara:strand:+ start:781 stop:1203 length:423 start_codon:yes stop_codon:yes gene_type:complete